jgi:hypothetical protein
LRQKRALRILVPGFFKSLFLKLVALLDNLGDPAGIPIITTESPSVFQLPDKPSPARSPVALPAT